MLSIYKREFVTEMPLAFVLTLAGMATLILPREMMLQKVGEKMLRYLFFVFIEKYEMRAYKNE